jgi:RNA polymerase sigma-70 factor, ECF subfamily
MGRSAAPAVQPFEEALVGSIPSLHRFALFLAGDASRADDLMQETFERALAHRDQFAPGTDCRAWLFKIAHNLHRRIESRARREVDNDDAALEALAAAGLYAGIRDIDPTGAMFEHPDLAAALDRALDRLSEEYRTVVVLVDLEDQSYAAAASILDVPVGTVRSRLFRARRLLQAELLTHAQDAGLVRPVMKGDPES